MKRMVALLMATISAVLLSAPAWAQVPPAPTYTGFEPILNNIIKGTPGLPGYTMSGVQDGVSLRSSGSVSVGLSNGQRIPVPVAAKATVSKAAMAKAASRLVAGASILGVAYQTYEVYNWIKGQNNPNVVVCPPPAFFCKPAPTTGPTPTVSPTETGWFFANGAWGDCDFPSSGCAVAAAAVQSCKWVWARETATVQSYGPSVLVNDRYQITVSCNAGDGRLSNATIARMSTAGQPGTYTPPPGTPYTAQELESGLIGTGGNWDPANSQKMREAILADNAKQKILTEEEITPKASPLTVEPIAPVTGTKTAVKTEVFKNADGSTTTRTTEETRTVVPVPSSNPGPATVESPAPAAPQFKEEIKTEVTDRNDTTGATTPVSTSTTYSPVSQQASEPQKLEIPDDYAREPTLQKIERSLDTTEAKEMPDQDKRVTDAAKKSEDDLKALRDAVATAQSADKSMWFSWVWTPPVGSCAASNKTLVGGAFINWDICPTVNNIKDVLGWLMALFGAWSIYGEIFRRND